MSASDVHAPSTSALYRTIHSQPAVICEVLREAVAPAEQAARLLARAQRVFLAGTGTSSHAAVVGEHLLRAAGADAYATTNADFALYPRRLGSSDALVAISHRGSKQFGRQAIALARAARASVIGLSGQNSPMEGADPLIQTAPQEVSSAHTASYTGNLAALAMIAVALGRQTGQDVGTLADALPALPAAIESLLAHEDDLRPLGQALATRGRVVLMGAGPNAVTAREGALKIKETSYLIAEGFELETALHGALQAVEAGDLAVVIAANGLALDRTIDLARALTILGARLLVVADERAIPVCRAADCLNTTATIYSLPAIPEPLSPILAAIPLQLLAEFTAQYRGTDPDIFRRDDPIYKAAVDSYAL